MSDASHGKSTAEGLPRPRTRQARRAFPWIWIVPILAAVTAVLYYLDYRAERAQEITITFSDAEGLKAGQTALNHFGVDLGTVSSLDLAPDRSSVQVHVQLHKSALDFAREGAVFWINRAEVSAGNISGLTTVVSGPYIDGTPGQGAPATAFVGLDKKPVSEGPGVTFLVHTVRLEHLGRDSAVNFRGIQVGVVQSVQLNDNGTGVNVRVFVHQRYAPLVRANSQFWLDSGINVSGGLFHDLKLNVESLRTLLGGAISFATPDDKAPAANGNSVFELNDEPKKDWLGWANGIRLPPESSIDGDKDESQKPMNLPKRIEQTAK